MNTKTDTCIIPCLQYRDGPTPPSTGCVVPSASKSTSPFMTARVAPSAHAELKLGSAFIMLGSRPNEVFRWKSPLDADGVTQSIYIVVDDADGHFARAKAAGAKIVRGLSDTDYGSREYSARDPEGHLWHFGTYRPGSLIPRAGASRDGWRRWLA